MLIIIDECPVSKNIYTNWHWKTRSNYKERISWIIYEFKSFEKQLKPDVYAELPYAKAKITIDIFFKTKRKRDIQNYMGGGLIAFLDCLVDLKFIKDDSADCIGQPKVTFNIDKDCGRTEIRIEAN